MRTILRHLIDDIERPPNRQFSNGRINTIIAVAAQLTLSDIKFKQRYLVDVNDKNITPDPTLTATRDNAFINIVVLKAACLLQTSFLRDAASNSIRIADGGSSISLSGRFEATEKASRNYCDMYEKAKWEFEAAGAQIPGKAILGPLSSDEFHFRSSFVGIRGERFN